MSPAHLLFALAINLVWGVNLVVLKLGLDELSPMLFGALRATIVLVFLLPWLKWKRGSMKMLLLAAMTVGPLHFATLFLGFKLIGDASAASIVTQLSIPFSTVLAVVFLGERLGPWRIGGLAMAFSGVALMTADPRVFSYVDGVIVLTLSQVAYAFGAIFMRQVKNVSVFEMQAWTSTLIAGTLIGLSLMFEQDQGQQLAELSAFGVGLVLYTGLGASLFGHGGVYYLYQRYPVSTVTPLFLLSPVFGIFASILLLGETLTSRMLIGGIITFLGVSVVTFREAMLARAKGL